MLNILELGATDLSAIDVRTLTPEEWQALKQEVNRRAHAERVQVMRGLVTWLRSRWQDGPRREGATRPRGLSHQERFSIAGRM